MIDARLLIKKIVSMTRLLIFVRSCLSEVVIHKWIDVDPMQRNLEIKEGAHQAARHHLGPSL